jgi:hypothetical protein
MLNECLRMHAPFDLRTSKAARPPPATLQTVYIAVFALLAYSAFANAGGAVVSSSPPATSVTVPPPNGETYVPSARPGRSRAG